MKRILIDIDCKGRIELQKLNRKGYYNFIKYITEEEILTLKKQFKGYEIVNKIKGAKKNDKTRANQKVKRIIKI